MLNVVDVKNIVKKGKKFKINLKKIWFIQFSMFCGFVVKAIGTRIKHFFIKFTLVC